MKLYSTPDLNRRYYKKKGTAVIKPINYLLKQLQLTCFWQLYTHKLYTQPPRLYYAQQSFRDSNHEAQKQARNKKSRFLEEQIEGLEHKFKEIGS